MSKADGAGHHSPVAMPHDYHTHADVSGGWLRAATFGAMDGLVSNTALIAGVAASADAHTVVISGVAGLLAGAFSMALGEYTSVTTANEQIDSEVDAEREAFRQFPYGEQLELVGMFKDMGMTEQTAQTAAAEVHRDEERALHFHVAQELGIDPREKPSATVAAVSSFLMFAVGALIPVLPYLFGLSGAAAVVTAAVLVGITLLGTGVVVGLLSGAPPLRRALRQLMIGYGAAGITWVLGLLVGGGVG